MRNSVLAVMASLAACAPGQGGPDGLVLDGNFGQTDLASLTEDCQGIAGLTGQSILDLRMDALSTTLSYVTATGSTVDPTSFELQLTWPTAPVATCYPAHEVSGQVLAGPRVAIDGLTLRAITGDGKFDETLEAKAWRATLNGNVQAPMMLAVTARPFLNGTWQPFPEYEGAAQTLSFFTSLNGQGGQSSGNLGLRDQLPAELNAAIVRSGFAVALW